MNIIPEYEEILCGIRSQFSFRHFCFGEAANEKIALQVMKYAIEKLLKWTPEQAFRFFTPEIVKKMKLEPLLKYIRFPCERSYEDTDYIVSLLYPKQVTYPFQKRVIQVYERVLAGEIKYPKDYMYGNKGLIRSHICLQYALKKSRLFNSKEELYHFFSTSQCSRFLKDMKLYQLYCNFYKTPVDYLHNSLSPDMRNELYYQYYLFSYLYRQKYRCEPPNLSDVKEEIRKVQKREAHRRASTENTEGT